MSVNWKHEYEWSLGMGAVGSCRRVL